MSMTTSLLRRVLLAGIVSIISFTLQPAARADQCGQSCRSGKHVCTMQARTSFIACLHGCGSGDAAPQCQSACRSTVRESRLACKATRADCATTCPASSAGADSCEAGCGGTASTCFAGVL